MFVKVYFYSTILVFGSYLFYFVCNLLMQKAPVDVVPEETWWSFNDAINKQDDPNIYPFEIKVSEQVSFYPILLFQ